MIKKIIFCEKMRRLPDFFMKQNVPQAKDLSIKMRRRPDFWTES